MASCHTHAAWKYLRGYGIRAIPSFFIPYRWVRGYGRMLYPPIYPLPMGAWVWQDAIPSYLSLTSGCVGMAGMPYPPIYPLPMGAWVWQDAIPSYLRFTTKITIKLTHRNYDKPNQKQSFQCARTHTVWFISIKAQFPTHLYIISLQIELKCVPLHRQKVNRLFRLVVIDLGF